MASLDRLEALDVELVLPGNRKPYMHIPSDAKCTASIIKSAPKKSSRPSRKAILVFAISFRVILALIFQCKKGSAASLISGFNSLSDEEKYQYDTDAIARDMRNKSIIYEHNKSRVQTSSAFVVSV